jgi:inhibitor of cysteine peptidase
MSAVVLGPGDHGSTVEARAGDEFIVRLPENASTGYRWALDALPDWLRVTGDQLDLDDPTTAGAGGTRVLTIAVDAAGEAELTLRKRRSWESDAVPEVDRFSATVRATG